MDWPCGGVGNTRFDGSAAAKAIGGSGPAGWARRRRKSCLDSEKSGREGASAAAHSSGGRLDIGPRLLVIIDGLPAQARPVILCGIDVNAIPMRTLGRQPTATRPLTSARLAAGLRAANNRRTAKIADLGDCRVGERHTCARASGRVAECRCRARLGRTGRVESAVQPVAALADCDGRSARGGGAQADADQRLIMIRINVLF
jgi:hypothetical protein